MVYADCGPLGNIQYGSVNTVAGTKFGDVATYTCDNGYRLEGPVTRTCMATGNWTASEPDCIIYGTF